MAMLVYRRVCFQNSLDFIVYIQQSIKYLAYQVSTRQANVSFFRNPDNSSNSFRAAAVLVAHSMTSNQLLHENQPAKDLR